MPVSSNVRPRIQRHPLPAASARMAFHDFEFQDTAQTLRQGLSEYFDKNPSLKRNAELSAQAREFFRCHDTVHVLYGCGTTMPDEAIVKLSSIAGTTGGLSILKGYMLHDTIDIYAKLPPLGTVFAILIAPFLIIRTLWRCSRQSKQWPWMDNDHFSDISLQSIRQEFRIKVAHQQKRDA